MQLYLDRKTKGRFPDAAVVPSEELSSSRAQRPIKPSIVAALGPFMENNRQGFRCPSDTTYFVRDRRPIRRASRSGSARDRPLTGGPSARIRGCVLRGHELRVSRPAPDHRTDCTQTRQDCGPHPGRGAHLPRAARARRRSSGSSTSSDALPRRFSCSADARRRPTSTTGPRPPKGPATSSTLTVTSKTSEPLRMLGQLRRISMAMSTAATSVPGRRQDHSGRPSAAVIGGPWAWLVGLAVRPWPF